MDKENSAWLDSIYSYGRIDYTQSRYRNTILKTERLIETTVTIQDSIDRKPPEHIIFQELALEHQLSLLSDPRTIPNFFPQSPDVHVEVEWQIQVVEGK